jgi:hypothetical protein
LYARKNKTKNKGVLHDGEKKGSERKSMSMTSMTPTTKGKLRQDLFHISRIHPKPTTTKPATTSIHPIFVFSHIISFLSLWIREHSMSFSNQFKFLFITTL